MQTVYILSGRPAGVGKSTISTALVSFLKNQWLHLTGIIRAWEE